MDVHNNTSDNTSDNTSNNNHDNDNDNDNNNDNDKNTNNDTTNIRRRTTSAPAISTASSLSPHQRRKSAVIRARAKWTRRFLHEVTAVTLWTLTILVLLCLASLYGWNNWAFHACMSIVMLVWDLVGLSALNSCMNPAVTLSHYLCGEVSLPDTLFASGVQLSTTVLIVAAFSRSLRHLLQLPPTPRPHPDAHWAAAAASEAFATAVLSLLSLSLPRVIQSRNVLRRWFVSSVCVVAAVTIATDWSGACMNPAFALALAAIHRHWTRHFVYWLGPILGAAFAALLHVVVIVPRFPSERSDESINSEIPNNNTETQTNRTDPTFKNE